jgi:hypothetical protein
MVSGFNSAENELEVDGALQQAQLSKPFEASQLLKKIRCLLDSEAGSKTLG